MNDCKTFQEKFERIAATRRRQKEHHKRFLAALKAKRVQEEVSGRPHNCRVFRNAIIPERLDERKIREQNK